MELLEKCYLHFRTSTSVHRFVWRQRPKRISFLHAHIRLSQKLRSYPRQIVIDRSTSNLDSVEQIRWLAGWGDLRFAVFREASLRSYSAGADCDRGSRRSCR
jgi:hypothetical protein